MDPLDATWRGIDRCTVPSSTTSGPVTTSIADCPDRHGVELITIAGAGHQWPGATAHSDLGGPVHPDPPSQDLDATSVIWQFFAAHPK
ncbi:hypothetical protein ACWPOB_16510 [Rhodococcus sp. 2H158]|nr:hypothetical protein GQ85_00210 [Rhodococcus rhodochrous]